MRRTDGRAAQAIGLATKTRECELGFNRSGYKWTTEHFVFNSVADEGIQEFADPPTATWKRVDGRTSGPVGRGTRTAGHALSLCVQVGCQGGDGRLHRPVLRTIVWGKLMEGWHESLVVSGHDANTPARGLHLHSQYAICYLYRGWSEIGPRRRLSVHHSHTVKPTNDGMTVP